MDVVLVVWWSGCSGSGRDALYPRAALSQASTQLAQLHDPRTLLAAAVACYQDAIITAAEKHAGQQLNERLDQDGRCPSIPPSCVAGATFRRWVIHLRVSAHLSTLSRSWVMLAFSSRRMTVRKIGKISRNQPCGVGSKVA